ncbi:hypothetical protein PPTG_05841 [Phytophthora nicotianae INRA-310]|uniref:Uncharacterized protein n=1 Tax=Phytophthora nicotianae (strain INRA-310) TaxID=761204 RepID=W2QU09_PHYN3|nr:hypothetical protein PPTG_05841 [Phytophthora nicotianae INRA-310]ETN16687.1 hypothetical protein PPTG_05841 [Phytophthora nicotianae INRA-310]
MEGSTRPGAKGKESGSAQGPCSAAYRSMPVCKWWIQLARSSHPAETRRAVYSGPSSPGWSKEEEYFGLHSRQLIFSVERNLDLPSKLKEIKVLTSQVDVLDIAGKGLITDEIMHKILAKIFGSKDGITVFDSSTLGTVVDGKVTTCVMGPLRAHYFGLHVSARV